MKIFIAAVVAFLVGVGCRFFDVPVPSPPALPGALLVIAMTLGYSATDRAVTGKAQRSATKHLCGGPTGITAVTIVTHRSLVAFAPNTVGTFKNVKSN